MRVRREDILKRPVAVTIKGDEAWLEKIYESFPTPESKETPRVTGQLKLSADPHDRVEVEGSLQYQPYVACSRCDDPIVWKADCTFRVMFREDDSDAGRNKVLSKDELDHFYFTEDGTVDLELLVNEQIQLTVPMQTVVAHKDDNGSCGICGTQLGDQVYQDRDDSKENPFAKLADLDLN